ncbi:hypothetical protein GCM10007148_06580 [Parvularcula lutaonensis]|nr:hypothetical protein GCM10007148_06580 [Parvularcula lutaonensis]
MLRQGHGEVNGVLVSRHRHSLSAGPTKHAIGSGFALASGPSSQSVAQLAPWRRGAFPISNQEVQVGDLKAPD